MKDQAVTDAPGSVRLQILTLGELAVTNQGVPLVGLASRKAMALLVYLACSRNTHPRTLLADLLWDDLPSERARGNLSVVLTSLRQQVGAYLLIDRYSVGFNPQPACHLDVAVFEDAIEAAHCATASDGTLPATTAAALEQAIALWRGDFLQGFELRGSTGFEEWVLAKQERVRQRLVAARSLLVATALRTQAFADGIAHAERLLAIDPLNEPAHRHLLMLLSASGQRASALAHYERYRHMLAVELDSAPDQGTVALYEQIRTGTHAGGDLGSIVRFAADPPAPRGAPSGRLPTPLTPLLGRALEQAQIRAVLDDPGCRLLTVLGPGGIGKTRLALDVAAAIADAPKRQRFVHGVVFVPLADLDEAGELAPAIANALRLGATPHDAVAQLMAYLREKQLLLVLDNLEQLLDGASLLGDILQSAAGVVILATSRERLGLVAERLLELGGLDHPPADPQLASEEPAPFRKTPPAPSAVAGYAAVRLFVERAQRVHPAFALDAATIPPVIEICRLVEGMPLAIELVAPWVRVLPCLEIARQLAHSLDVLTTTLRDRPSRHASMRAVFDHSWRLLRPDEQAFLRRLSVFRAGWTLGEASYVAATIDGERRSHLHLLASLLDKSLLQGDAAGRYGLHELVRQYADERLRDKAPEYEATHAWHARHYAAWVSQRVGRLSGPEQRAALDELTPEFGNIRAGWQWAMAHRDTDVLDAMLVGLAMFCDARSRFQEGYDLLAQAVRALDEQPTPAASATLARLASRQALFCERLGRYDEGEALARRSLALIEIDGDAFEQAYVLGVMGRFAERRGAYREAQAIQRASLALYRALGEQFGIASALYHLGSAAEGMGQYEEARQFTEASRALRQGLGDRRGEAFCFNNLGIIAEMQQHYDVAAQCYEQSLALFALLGDTWAMTLPLSNLGDLHSTLGDKNAAVSYYQRSLDIGLELWVVPQMLTDLVKLAALCARANRPLLAATLIALPLSYPATTHAFQAQALRLRAEIDALEMPAVLERVIAEAQAQTLEAIVQEALAWIAAGCL